MRLAISIVALCASCGDANRVELTDDSEDVAPPRVTTRQVAQIRSRQPIRAVGTTAPARVSELGPVVSAIVRSVHVNEGQRVERGQLLVRLDAADARLAAAQATASAAAARAQAELARAETERLVPLAADGTITPQRADQLQAQERALSSAAEAADIAAQQARRNVSDTSVRAPFSGTIARVYVEAGEMASRAPPTTLLRLVDLSTMEVRARVHESKLSAVEEGSAVRVRAGGVEAQGVVEYINPELDASTRSADVVVRVPNEGGRLRAGMSADLEIEPSAETDALLVPWLAIIPEGDARSVFVVIDGRVQRREILATSYDDEHALVVDGVEDGDVVVVEGHEGLSDGIQVDVMSGGPT